MKFANKHFHQNQTWKKNSNLGNVVLNWMEQKINKFFMNEQHFSSIRKYFDNNYFVIKLFGLPAHLLNKQSNELLIELIARLGCSVQL